MIDDDEEKIAEFVKWIEDMAWHYGLACRVDPEFIQGMIDIRLRRGRMTTALLKDNVVQQIAIVVSKMELSLIRLSAKEFARLKFAEAFVGLELIK